LKGLKLPKVGTFLKLIKPREEGTGSKEKTDILRGVYPRAKDIGFLLAPGSSVFICVSFDKLRTGICGRMPCCV